MCQNVMKIYYLKLKLTFFLISVACNVLIYLVNKNITKYQFGIYIAVSIWCEVIPFIKL